MTPNTLVAVTEYEEARARLEQCFTEFGVFNKVGEYLDLKYGSDWRKYLLYKNQITADDDEIAELCKNVANDSLIVSVKFINYCRSFNRLYAQVTTIIELGIAELLRGCLPSRLDSMDLLFLAAKCPLEHFKWILDNWEKIDCDRESIKGSLVQYNEDPLTVDPEYDSFDEWMAEHWTYFESRGYWIDVDRYFNEPQSLIRDYVANIMLQIRPEAENLYWAILHGLPMQKLLAKRIQYGGYDNHIRRYWPLVQNELDISTTLVYSQSIDCIYFLLNLLRDHSFNIDRFRTESIQQHDFNRLLALHFAGYDPLLGHEPIIDYIRLFINLLRRGHFDDFSFETLGIVNEMLLSEINNAKKTKCSDFLGADNLKRAIVRNTDVKFIKFLQQLDLPTVLSELLQPEYWYTMPKEIKEIFLILELISRNTTSIYSILPPELSWCIFTFAYATLQF